MSKLNAARESARTDQLFVKHSGGDFVVQKKRDAVEQITAILKQAELGTPVADLCRKFGISERSFYR